MKGISPLVFRGILSLAPLLAASQARAGGWKSYLPEQALLGPQAGIQAMRFRASEDYRALIEPVPAESRPWTRLSWGADFSVRWRPGLILSLSPRRETYGLRTVEDTVSFRGNPYPHSLEARTELTYNVWPILAGFGWFSGGRHAQARLGWYRAYFDAGGVDWTVDGSRYSGTPRAPVRKSFDGWMLVVEYGFRWGPGELSLGVESMRAFDSVFDGLRGSLRPEAAQVRLGYAWTLWNRSRAR